MKTFVRFFREVSTEYCMKSRAMVPVKPKMVEMCGMDSVFILDGRNNIDLMIADVKQRIDKLKNVAPDIAGFKILRGETFARNFSVVHSSF